MKNMKKIKTITNLNLKNYSTLRIESFAEIAYFPKSEEEILQILNHTEHPVIIGEGSDIIFSSAGVKKPLIFLKEMKKTEITENILYAEAGAKSPKLSRFALESEITGFEFLVGIPSSIGGNIFMNAGANNQAISDNLISVRTIDIKNKEVREFKKEELDFGYRSSLFRKNPGKYIILSAKFEIKKGEKEEIEVLMEENLQKRKISQPSLKLPNAGSTFKNPKNNSAGRLIEECGLKGEISGGAKIYEKHANFIVNYNNATSEDIILLMSKMQDCVYNKFKIKLENEIEFIGEGNKTEEALWKKITTV